MKAAAFLLLALIASFACAVDLPRATPESQGVSSAAIRAFVEAADQQVDTMNSFMLVRHGKVIAEGWWAPYAPQTPHILHSLSKSFTSTAVGLAIREGKLSLDDTVTSFFPDEVPADAPANLKAMRVRDLLIMSTGHQALPKTDPAATEPWTKTFLAQPVPFKPGTHFLYNTPGTYVQSAIVQKVAGKPVLDYLERRLFEPLGIDTPRWGVSPQGVNFGGWGLYLRTQDIAKFGQLYLQRGYWNGKPVIPADWVAQATSKQTSNGSNPKSDWDQGYGYQFWRCRHNAFRGDGANGQFCVVMPDQDAVVAITSGSRSMQAVLDLVWDKLLPAFDASPSNETEQAKLKQTLAALSVRQPQGATTPAHLPGFAGKDFHFESNASRIDAIKLDVANDKTTVTLTIAGKPYAIPCGHGSWERSHALLGSFLTAADQPVAAAGAWTADDTFTAKVVLDETETYYVFTLKAKDVDLQVTIGSNVGAPKPIELIGHAVVP
jgi:CubicO group peptidase (beta-lactamase class C family)